MRFTFVAAAFLLATRGARADYLEPRQNIVESLLSAFGPKTDDDDDKPTKKTTASAKPSKTPTAEPTTTKKSQPTTRVETKTTPTAKPSTTSKETETESTTDTSTITSLATLTDTTTTSASPTSTQTSEPVNPRPATQAKSGGISTAGIAVAVIFSIVILLVIAWVTFRYHPKCRAWWQARQEEKYKQRSYRDALDGPNAGGGGLTRGRAGLQSFFHPKTARSQAGSVIGGIKRKTIHWGAPSPKGDSHDVEFGMAQTRGLAQNPFGDEHGVARTYSKNNGGSPHGYPSGEKVPLAELASPMGIDRDPPRRQDLSPSPRPAMPHSPSMSPISPMEGGRKSSGTMSSMTGSTNTPRTGSTQSLGSRTTKRESKALPHVKVNGQVIYELA